MGLHRFVIPAEAGSMRADAMVRLFLPALPESALRKVFDARDVKLDGCRVRRDAPVHAGQELKVYLPDTRPEASIAVVYEDADVLLVNKRPGLSVTEDGSGGVTLTELCRQYLGSADPVSPFPAPCHRLDNQTSGLCLFAKNENALNILFRVFKDRTLEKDYVCLVRGIPKPASAVCKAWLLREEEQARVRITDTPESGARVILTGYETLEAGPVSRLRVHLITGRTHQIRAHLAALGHPILGDDLYGSRDFNRQYKARLLKLCAVSLRLDTGGLLPRLDHRLFSIDPPF